MSFLLIKNHLPAFFISEPKLRGLAFKLPVVTGAAPSPLEVGHNLRLTRDSTTSLLGGQGIGFEEGAHFFPLPFLSTPSGIRTQTFSVVSRVITTAPQVCLSHLVAKGECSGVRG